MFVFLLEEDIVIYIEIVVFEKYEIFLERLEIFFG